MDGQPRSTHKTVYSQNTSINAKRTFTNEKRQISLVADDELLARVERQLQKSKALFPG